MSVVQRQQGLAQRLAVRDLGCCNGLNFSIVHLNRLERDGSSLNRLGIPKSEGF